MHETTLARFWAFVEKSDGCWTWNGARNYRGYGRFKWNGVHYRAHRFAWVIEHGEPPPDMLVCHKCDNPSCVRVDHLFLGTREENSRDMVKKGRAPVQPRGEACFSVKLTEAKVRDARAKHAHGVPYLDLAKEYGVSRDTIRDAIRGFTWKHVT